MFNKNIVLSVVFFFCSLIHAFAYDLIESDWTQMKTVASRDAFSFSYIAFPQGTTPETYNYDVYGANTDFYFKAVLSDPTEVNDFETNYKAGATEVGSEDEAIADARIPVTMVNQVTTTSVTPLQTILTYTVPSNHTFHCEQWMVGRINSGNSEIALAQVQVNGVVADGQTQTGNNTTPQYERKFAHPLPCAHAGDVITIKITPASTSSTLFSGRLLGELR